jgi:hypothetical protein
MAGLRCDARHFPFVIGRSPSAQCRVEEQGVWEQHLRIVLDRERGCVLSVQPEAIASVNGEVVREAVLRNGDIISIGASQIRFLLGPTHHRSLRLREWLTWLGLVSLCLGQVALIYWLLG